MPVKLKDIAREVGVSIGTASLVLNSRKSKVPISQATRQRVLEAAERLGYKPNWAARGLRMKRTHTVGIVSYDNDDPLAISISSRLDQLLLDRGYRTVVGDAKHSAERAKLHMEDFAASGADALVLLASSYTLDKRSLSPFTDEDRPIVCIGRDMSASGIYSLMVDNKAGARLAALHLLQLGYRRIGIIVGAEMYTPENELRLAGALEACEESGVEVPRDFVVRETDGGWNPQAGYQSMHRLLELRDRPEAIIAFDDCTAFGAIRAVFEAGLQVPGDIAVVGFDDLMVSAFYNPPLTTVRQPVDGMAERAVGYLYAVLEGEGGPEPRLEKLTPELVVRSSFGASRR